MAAMGVQSDIWIGRCHLKNFKMAATADFSNSDSCLTAASHQVSAHFNLQFPICEKLTTH